MIFVLALAAVAIVVVCVLWLWFFVLRKQSNDLEELGVKTVYPRTSVLPAPKIEAYCEIKDRLRRQYARDSDDDDRWMSALPLQAKDMLKYRLMQRAIGDMASLQKIDADARGYWRLFTKGVITRKFWNSVVEVEKELSQELENVKTEAQFIEPTQDPQGIISEAMHFILRYGDKLPSAAEIASSADAITDMIRSLAPGQGTGGSGPASVPGMPPGMPPGMALPGMPGMPGMPPGMRPPGAPGGPPAVQSGGGTEDCSWKQDQDEVEVTVSVPNNAVKSQVKVVIQAAALKVLHADEVLAEGKLAGRCRPEESTWTMSRGRVVVSLEKANPAPWPSLFKKA